MSSIESIIPTILPAMHTMTDSSITVNNMVDLRAPIARSMPISLVRSDTDMTMTIRVTMPATISITNVDHADESPRGAHHCVQALLHIVRRHDVETGELCFYVL